MAGLVLTVRLGKGGGWVTLFKVFYNPSGRSYSWNLGVVGAPLAKATGKNAEV